MDGFTVRAAARGGGRRILPTPHGGTRQPLLPRQSIARCQADHGLRPAGLITSNLLGSPGLESRRCLAVPRRR